MGGPGGGGGVLVLGAAGGTITDLGTVSTVGGGKTGGNGLVLALDTTFIGTTLGRFSEDNVGASDPLMITDLGGIGGAGGGAGEGFAFVPKPASIVIFSLELLRGRPANSFRKHHIPDFSNWKEHEAFEAAFAQLLDDLNADVAPVCPTG